MLRGKEETLSLDETCILITETSAPDEIGNDMSKESGFEVFCAKLPIASNRFFQAAQSGIKISYILAINIIDYDEQLKVEFDGDTYEVFRTYPRADELVEIYLRQKAGVGKCQNAQ